MNREDAEKRVNEVFSLYEQFGEADYIGEPVSQIEHMCQAAELAESTGHDEETILAAFFHDIGHLCEHVMDTDNMNGYGVVDHEKLAGVYLRQMGFSEKVARLAERHVVAKRYLTYRYPDYYNKLSEASKMTLIEQGGVMSAEEAAGFESDEWHPLYMKLRVWDDLAKETGKALPDLSLYRAMALRNLLR